MDRIERCHTQIWDTSQQILSLGGTVILDLGFTLKSQRDEFRDKAKALGVEAEVHYLDTPNELRRQRVSQRNTEKDPKVYAFEVTDEMFDFMEPRFEIPDDTELENGLIIMS